MSNTRRLLLKKTSWAIDVSLSRLRLATLSSSKTSNAIRVESLEALLGINRETIAKSKVEIIIEATIVSQKFTSNQITRWNDRVATSLSLANLTNQDEILNTQISISIPLANLSLSTKDLEKCHLPDKGIFRICKSEVESKNQGAEET